MQVSWHSLGAPAVVPNMECCLHQARLDTKKELQADVDRTVAHQKALLEKRFEEQVESCNKHLHQISLQPKHHPM